MLNNFQELKALFRETKQEVYRTQLGWEKGLLWLGEINHLFTLFLFSISYCYFGILLFFSLSWLYVSSGWSILHQVNLFIPQVQASGCIKQLSLHPWKNTE